MTFILNRIAGHIRISPRGVCPSRPIIHGDEPSSRLTRVAQNTIAPRWWGCQTKKPLPFGAAVLGSGSAGDFEIARLAKDEASARSLAKPGSDASRAIASRTKFSLWACRAEYALELQVSNSLPSGWVPPRFCSRLRPRLEAQGCQGRRSIYVGCQ